MLLKLLLGFYSPQQGEIKVGNTPLSTIKPQFWRQSCGVVMQEGFIFSDTIANNSAVNSDALDMKKLLHAMRLANIWEFVSSLPLGLQTKIGAEGNGWK
ncbi:ATP-binding cassette domain-containing protein [Rufibacter quisquiliarum]|uniref:ABC-type bacteriocin/lantibiotic exporter with double-glycine peptidase domain n=1 Tax=Rufibacter quisquiliarum TaxID=1549639 RepID=A0A839GFC7_9BACT|nr:ATP-binding cassette domain-containing protein [Rufibacter quisquiliarum]MBA9077602.1 ABC-type bacteriocin/lantibiotic exporter with double-glycine peptidase domain [Rufibacter quisquiliarum]